MVINFIVFIILSIESVSDIRTKSLSINRLIVYFLFSVATNIIFSYQTVYSMIGGMFLGIAILLYGKMTREGIGYGDGIIFVCLGAMIGLRANLKLLFLSLILFIIVGGVYTLVARKKINTQMPFVPCVLGAFIYMIIGQMR